MRESAESTSLLRELSELIDRPLPPHHDITTKPSAFVNFLSLIKEHMHELVNEKDGLQRTLSAEQAVRVSNEQAVRILEGKYKRQEEELVHTKELLTTLQNQATVSMSDQEGIASHEAKVKKLQARVTELDGEVADYIKLVERKQGEVDSLNGQLESQSTRLRELRELNARAEDAMLEVQSKLAQAQSSVNVTQKEMERYKKQLEWNEHELEQSTETFNTYRKQKSAECSELQLRLDAATGQVQAIESQFVEVKSLV